jgi:hypothetical protein
MHKANVTLKGKLDSLQRVPTRTATIMVTFSIDKTPCKAFGKEAEAFLSRAHGKIVELLGYYETHLPKFGREFVTVGARLLPNESSASTASAPEVGQGIDKGEAPQLSVQSPSAPIEPIPVKESIGVKTDLAARKPSGPSSSIPLARAPLPADDGERVKPVTFEDMENEYKAQKAARELEKLKQAASQGIEAGQAA